MNDEPFDPTESPKVIRVIVDPPDPVTHAIYHHRYTHKRLSASCARADSVQAKREGRDVTDEDRAELEAADRAERDALAEMFGTPPRTATGVRELLQYVQGFGRIAWAPDDLDQMFA